MINYKIVRFVRIFALMFLVTAVNAAEPVIWKTDSRAEIMRGDARGVSIADDGTIILAPRLTEIYNSQQAFVWSSVTDAAGNVFLGTGSDGRIFKVGADGKGALFADFTELDVTALTFGKDGALFAATSPDGKVYRVAADGKFEPHFDPADKYIWSLATMNDGAIAIGTGENGKIYRVRAANAAPDASLLFDSSETHIISLKLDNAGNLIAGTDSNGVVLRVAPDGKAFALLDAPAPLREIHEIAIGSDNSIYVLALSDTASSSNTGNAATSGGAAASGGVTVSVSNVFVAEDPNAPPVPPRSRNDLTAAKSAVYRITPDGGNQIIWSSPNVTGFALAANPNGNGVLIGTSDKGRIYSVTNDGRETLLLQTNENQISSFLTRGNQIYATSSNGAKLYRFGTETAGEGAFDSVVRDARSAALWGRIWWTANGAVDFQTRTGNTEKPDATWSDWSAIYRDGGGAQVKSPNARFLQWRAVLRSGAATANVSEVNVSYLAGNIAPEITGITVLPTNVGLASNAAPPTDPNIENSGIDPVFFGLPPAQPVPPRRLFQRGARGLQWTAEDRNADKIEFSVLYRAVDEQSFRLLKSGLRENFYTIDGAALADGRYIFKITASDAPSNPFGKNIISERLSEIVEIDNSAPQITVAAAPVVSGERARAAFEATDAASGIRRAEISLNGGDWQTILADDGISDSTRERYTIDIAIPTGEQTVSLRVFDANGNSNSARVNVRR